MKMADLLRQLADRLDGIEGPEGSTPNEPEQDSSEEQPVMINPQQAKLELLKKGVGVESVYDDDSNDEINAIKKNAGINPAVIHAAADNDPLE
jgi:hypothetical protein